MKKTALIIAETPFQIISCLSYYLSESRVLSDFVFDLAIYGQFKNAEKYAERIRSALEFGAVYCVPPFYRKTFREGLSHGIELLLHEQQNRERFEANCPFHKNAYDMLVCAGATRLPIDTKRYCAPRAFTILVEDGNGSYSGAIAKAFAFGDDVLNGKLIQYTHEERAKKLAKAAFSALTKKRYHLHPRALYLFNPDDEVKHLYKGLEVRALNRSLLYDEKLIELVFGSPHFLGYQMIDTVFLSLSDNMPDAALNVQRECLSIVAAHMTGRAILRNHPRSESLDAEGLITDSENYPWEALCARRWIDNDALLIGFGSTAQQIPRDLFGLEPECIYLHRLLPENISLRTNIEKVYSDAVEHYSDKTRIAAPTSLKEFTQILSNKSPGRISKTGGR